MTFHREKPAGLRAREKSEEKSEASARRVQMPCLTNRSLKPPLSIFISFSLYKRVLENIKIHHQALFPTECGDSLCVLKHNQEIQRNTGSDLLNRVEKKKKVVEIGEFETEKTGEGQEGPFGRALPHSVL